MSRASIQLDPSKVKLKIAHSGLRSKQLLKGMSEKTVQRLKAGQNTTWATAHKLAVSLNTTVEDLMSSVAPGEMDAFLPDQWLYDEARSGTCAINHKPFWMAIGRGAIGYLIGPPPIDLRNPIAQLREWHGSRCRKIVLRQEDLAFIVEIHYFDYSPDTQQRINYYASTACRFFPLARRGDCFTKVALSDLLHRYVWRRLKQEALANAEIVAIEGHDYPEHPHAYFPLVRFYQGTPLKRIALGARIFTQLHADFRWSLLTFLESMDGRRVRAKRTDAGIALTIDAIRPAAYKLGWEEEVLEIEVYLAWRTNDGCFELAPWRETHRDQFVEAINVRKWSDCSSRGMPLPYCPEDCEDEPFPPPFQPDFTLTEKTIAAINAMHDPDPFGSMWEE